MSEPLSLFRSILARLERGESCALCAVVNTRGSTPQTSGALLLVDRTGNTEGTIGGGCVEAEVRRRALALIPSGESAMASFDLDHDIGWDGGLICGGQLDVALVVLAGASQAARWRQHVEQIERQQLACISLRVRQEGKTVEYRLHVEPTPTLLVAGAGHVGAALARLAAELNFRAVVIDDRADLLVPSRLPPPIETAEGAIAEVLAHWPIDANTYIVVVTRGHDHDERALHAVIDSPAKYLGMIGSRRKVRLLFDDLESLGVDRSRLERIHAPIGLSIGSVTVPEIAVSIAAELIQVRRAERRCAVEGPFEVADQGGIWD